MDKWKALVAIVKDFNAQGCHVLALMAVIVIVLVPPGMFVVASYMSITRIPWRSLG